MLIKVFGIWLVAANIAVLEPQKQDCTISFVSGGGYYVSGAGYYDRHIQEKIENHTCDEVATEINKQAQDSAFVAHPTTSYHVTKGIKEYE